MRINFKINIPEDIHIISWIFKNNGYELMLVGGCVRDSFLNESVKDYDLVTNAIPDKIIELLKDEPIVTNIIETGKQFGVVNVITENGEYEIATYRFETYRDYNLDNFINYIKDKISDEELINFKNKLMK